MSDSAKETFSAGRLVVRKHAPYLRAMVLGFAPVEVHGLGTIGVTEHGVMLIDWEFIAKVSADEMGGLFAHECLHLMLKHSTRAKRAGRDPELDNKAADLAINGMVLDMGFKLPGGGPGVTPDHPHHGLYPEDFGWKRGLTTDEYYELLRQKRAQDKQKQQGQKGKGQPQPGQGQGGAGGEGEPDEENDEEGEGGSGGDDDHQKPGGGAPKQPRPASDESKEQPKAGGGWCGSCAGRPMPGEPDEKHKASRPTTEIDRMARQVAEAIRENAQHGKGNVPGFLTRWADEILAPPEVPWEKELAVITRAACAWREHAVDHRYDAPSRRQAGIGYGPGKPILPRFRMPVPNVGVIGDTSGSMGASELGESARETAGILKAIGANVTYCAADACVQGIVKVRGVADILAALKGGGGTDMKPAIAAMLKERPRFEVIVCITDGMIGDIGPEPPGVKFIWVVVGPYQTDRDLVWGKVIMLKHHVRKAA